MLTNILTAAISIFQTESNDREGNSAVELVPYLQVRASLFSMFSPVPLVPIGNNAFFTPRISTTSMVWNSDVYALQRRHRMRRVSLPANLEPS